MAGDYDVYQFCPCGSGKKLKFCCHAIVADMSKVQDLLVHHQRQMALDVLETLEKKDLKEVWSRAWVRSIKARILFTQKQHDESRQLVEDVLDELPDHPESATLYGMITLFDEGYPAAKRAVYDAFRVSFGRRSPMTAQLALGLGTILMTRGNPLAARECFARAIIFDNNNESAVRALVELGELETIPYPLRSHYALEGFRGEERSKPDYDAAIELANVGCFSDAAKAFGQIARQAPQTPGIWRNMALCHAWADERPLAVQAFKAAAGNETDPESAADCLLLAHLLRTPAEAEVVERVARKHSVKSVGRLLTLLDQHPRFVRVEDEDFDDDQDVARPAAWYQALDREEQPAGGRELTFRDVPRIVGQIQVFDADPERGTPANALLGAVGRDALERLQEEFSAVAAGEAEPEGDPIVVGVLPAESQELLWSWLLPDGLSAYQEEALQQARWRHVVDELWMNAPHRLLEGRTPLEAAALPDMQVPLIAAVLALDVLAEQSEFTLEDAELRQRLNLPPVSLLEVSPETEIERFSRLSLRRVPWNRLTDEQLLGLTRFAGHFSHSRVRHELAREFLDRPSLAEKVDRPELCISLFALCRRRFRSDLALEWLEQAKQEGKARKIALEQLLLWELEEVMLRRGDRDDPKLQELAATLWNYYRPKVARSTELIAGILNDLKLSGPWNAVPSAGAATKEPLATAGVGAGGIWTPETQEAGQPSKLWMPGD